MSIPLTQTRLKSLLDYDKDTGVFTWISARGSRVKAGSKAGVVMTRGYIQIGIDGKYYRGHRLAWLFIYGANPSMDIDHIDGNKTNNAIANLREASEFVNLQNQRKAHKRNKTGLLGVCKSQGRFAARIRVRGKDLWLGRFDTQDAAHKAYIEAKRQLHEGNTL